MSGWQPPGSLERVELLTPTKNRHALEEELRHQATLGRHDHPVVTINLRDYLVTPLTVAVRERAPTRQPHELGR